MTYKNDLLLRAAKGEITERTPVWLMRQAGRILKEYREIRNSLSGFKELVSNPELAAEVSIQPVDLLGVDAAIIFSDILVIPEALGYDYEMIEKKGPLFPKTIQSELDVEKIDENSAAEKLQYVYDAIEICVKNLDGRVPLIGFAGAPWTIMAYMVEGSGSKTFSKSRALLYQQPQVAHALLEKITVATIAYLKNQIKSGAAIVQIFDSWAGILPPDQYSEFAIPYISKICDAIEDVPITVFSKGATFSIAEISGLNCDTIGLDWNTPVSFVKSQLKSPKTLQGNLDPAALYASDTKLVSATKNMLEEFKGIHHIANLGHGVYPDTDPEKVKLFIETVKNHSSKN